MPRTVQKRLSEIWLENGIHTFMQWLRLSFSAVYRSILTCIVLCNCGAVCHHFNKVFMAPQIQLWCWHCAPYKCSYYYYYVCIEWTVLSATVPLLLLHRVSGTVCPMPPVTIIWRYVSRLRCVQLTLRIKMAWGVRWAESSPLTLKEFFVALYLQFWDIMMFCFLAFVALWYLHTWFNSLTELVDYIDFH